MPEILLEIADKATPERNVFLNAQRVEMYQSKVREEEDTVEKIKLRTFLPIELLRAGQIAAALEETLDLQRLAVQWNTPENAPVMRSFREFLALAYLRLGQQENYILQHSSDSCLMPIQGGGIHKIQRGSRMAIKGFLSLLEEEPDNLGYRWLLNLAYMTLGEYPGKVPEKWLIPPRVFDSDFEIDRFREIAPKLGVDINGRAGGSIVEDFDRDGYLDIMASSNGLRDQLRYFHNNGDGSFSEWTAKGGLLGQVGGLNALQADYNNDGYPDILVLRGGWFSVQGKDQGNYPNSLLRNNGDGTFTDTTIESGIFSLHPSQTAAWADFDLDGWLDLFIGNESTSNQIHPCELFRNNGNGTFTEIASKVKLDHTGFVKGVAWGDYNNDGYPDLYLSQFEDKNLLFRNDGPKGNGWSFTEVTAAAGVAEPKLSFPTWFWDYDNDGWEDILVASFTSHTEDNLDDVVADYLGLRKAAHPRLYRNNRDGTFTDVTKEARFDVVLMAMGANFGDLDNDGFLDCYFGTGHSKMDTLVPNRMFRNSNGRFFQDVTTSGGFGHLQKGHGISFGDIDNDGDQDIYAVLGGSYSGDTFQNALFENPGFSNHWITLRLEGVKSNRSALGARIKVTTLTKEGEREIFVTVSTGGSFGASSLQQEIGLGRAKAIKSIEITWPNRDRTVQKISGVGLDQFIGIREGAPKPEVLRLKQIDFSPGNPLKHTGHGGP
ncbi:CRTAC1 family protein [Acidobacteria bacterium AH-259-O06]|nr:CRTAC1 family protein [Acidobacteria bacterium AH-259-O06]